MATQILRGRILVCAKKIRSINLIGGKCKKCGETDIHKLCFHHVDDSTKEIEFNRAKYRRWSVLEAEINKCELLCHNCHIEHHNINDSNDMRFKNNKKIFLTYKGLSCQECGYNKCNSSLHFHHLSDKKFTLANVSVNCKTINNVSQSIIDELDKCVVLCANCHHKKHTDIEFYKTYENQIAIKSNTMSEKQPKIDRELIIKLYTQDNMTQADIARKINADTGCVCKIITELGIKKDKIKYKIIELYKSGLSKSDIARQLNMSYNGVIHHLKDLK